MKFKGLDGRPRTLKHSQKYLINWEAPSLSKFQTSVKNFLEPYWCGHVVFEEMRIVGTRLSLDFYNASRKIAVEVQGAQHEKFVEHFHGNRLKFVDQLKRDQKKLDFCEENDILLVEIYPRDEIGLKVFESQGVYL